MLKDQRTTVHFMIIFFVAAVFIWSLIKPEGYLIWTMEVLPAVVLWIIVLAVYKRFRFTTLSYIVMAILSILMFIGAHYTYAKVPLFDWIKDYFDLSRNHYDRFGHFFKGLLAIVIRELLLRLSPLKRNAWITSITLSIALAISALYEIIEWAASAVSKGGKTSKEFLGTQGDIWDTQWDMTLLLIGSILALLLLSNYHNKQLKKLD